MQTCLSFASICESNNTKSARNVETGAERGWKGSGDGRRK